MGTYQVINTGYVSEAQVYGWKKRMGGCLTKKKDKKDYTLRKKTFLIYQFNLAAKESKEDELAHHIYAFM